VEEIQENAANKLKETVGIIGASPLQKGMKNFMLSLREQRRKAHPTTKKG
jgi:hypothetical protein